MDLDAEYQKLKSQKSEIEERVKENCRKGEIAASITTNEELFSLKEAIANKYAEIKIAKYESSNVNNLLEETTADLINLHIQKLELDEALGEQKQ